MVGLAEENSAGSAKDWSSDIPAAQTLPKIQIWMTMTKMINMMMMMMMSNNKTSTVNNKNNSNKNNNNIQGVSKKR